METNPTPSNPPFSLILSGGGMRCSWSAGFLVGLQELKLIPSVIVAKSGNAGNAVYMATEQLGMVKRIWTTHLTGNRFIKWWRISKIIDIDYLVDEVLTIKEPTDYDALKKSPIKVLIACFNTTQQRVDYFSNKDITSSVLRATKAMPYVYGKKIKIGGNFYVDNPQSTISLIEDSKSLLTKKILCVDVMEQNKYIKIISKFIGLKVVSETKLPKNILTIAPPTIAVHILSSSKKKLETTFDQGYSYALSQEKNIREYLGHKNSLC